MLSSKLVKNSKLKIYPEGAHGLTDTAKDQLNKDLLDFVKSPDLATNEANKPSYNKKQYENNQAIYEAVH